MRLGDVWPDYAKVMQQLRRVRAVAQQDPNYPNIFRTISSSGTNGSPLHQLGQAQSNLSSEQDVTLTSSCDIQGSNRGTPPPHGIHSGRRQRHCAHPRTPESFYLSVQKGGSVTEDGNLLVTDGGCKHNTVPHVTISRAAHFAQDLSTDDFL